MFRSLLAACLALGLALVLGAPPAAATGAASAPEGETGAETETVTKVEFRDLFDARGKPTDLAVSLSGALVAMEGFLAPPPSAKSPFYVAVGAPTKHCPYCTAVNETDHLPYVLVYPHDDQPQVGSRGRLIFVGRLEAEHEDEAFFGIHNDIRLRGASIVRIDYMRRRGLRPGMSAALVEEADARRRAAEARARADRAAGYSAENPAPESFAPIDFRTIGRDEDEDD